MTLKTQMVTDLAIFFNQDEFAVDVVHVEAAKTVKAIIDFAKVYEFSGSSGVERARFWVKFADTVVHLNDTFTYAGKNWLVESVDFTDTYIQSFICRSSVAVTI